MCGANATMGGFRLAVYLLLAWVVFWMAAYRGLWYDSHVFGRKDPSFEFSAGYFDVSGGKSRVLVFFAAPIFLSIFCGASYEAVWKAQQLGGEDSPRHTVTYVASRRPSLLRTILLQNLRIWGRGSPWITVGEAAALVMYLLALLTMVWQGARFKMDAYYHGTMPCAADPSTRCDEGTDHIAISSSVTLLKNVAKYLGFAAAFQFSLVLVPMSRDSKLWCALGVQFERAVVYHTVLGHLAFLSLYVHGFLYMLYFVLKHDLGYAINSAFHYDGHGVNVPAGLVAGLCALPMWITSLEYVRRRYYRLFKTSHFLFVGVIAAALVHYDGFVYYLVPGFTVYLVHAVSRQGNWKWWDSGNWCPRSNPCKIHNLVHLHTEADYTRLVLRNPGKLLAKGGEMVYISAPSLLGTIEAHPMSVALRGAPPSLWPLSGYNNKRIFTLYVKTMGTWTRALNEENNQNLSVAVDGFYSSVSGLIAMKESGYDRILLFAGGSGFTTFLALIQDWCEADASGDDVPTIHLVWCCRRKAEMQLLGEALPSLLSSAGDASELRFNITLFCSGEKGMGDSFSVSWPVAAKPQDTGHVRGITPYGVFHSVNSGISTVIAGVGAVIGWLWSENLAEGALLKGVATITLMAAVSIIMLLLYGWGSGLVYQCWLQKRPSGWFPRKRYLPLRPAGTSDEVKEAPAGDDDVAATFPVRAGRTPVHAMLKAEEALAKRGSIGKVKVLASGPGGMVDSVVTEARKVNWRRFHVEVSSREF